MPFLRSNEVSTGSLEQKNCAASLRSFLVTDATRMRALTLVRDLELPDCWIGAGFVRSLVWDRLHGRAESALNGDVDVIFFDPHRLTSSDDEVIEWHLHSLNPLIDWSVRNQARMHLRNGDAPYVDCTEAIAHWPETATAVAVRLVGMHIEISAPHGLHDLFGMNVVPTRHFLGDRLQVVRQRTTSKRWLQRWPHVRASFL